VVDNRTETAPLFGELLKTFRRPLGMGLVLSGLALLMVVLVMQLRNAGSGVKTDGYFDSAETTPVKKEFRAHRFERLERRQVQRYGLQKIDQQSVRIWQDIGIFESEATAWRQKFQDLLTSETGKKLKDDAWVVRYFWDQWNGRLPNPGTAGEYRDNLNTLMVSIKECLKKETTAYTPSQTLRDEIDLIETQVKEARDSYNRHRRLLDALTGMIAADIPFDQETLKDRVEQLDQEMILEDFGYLSPSLASSLGNTPASAAQAPIAPEGAGPSHGGLDELHAQATRQLEGRRDYGRSTQIRDSVRNRTGRAR
jgi:hypothetical protein